MSSSIDPASKSFFSLDTPNAIPLNSRQSYVRGWFVSEDNHPYELWLTVDQERIPAFTALARPDVLRHHKNNPVFANSGFLVRFDRPTLQGSITLVAAIEGRETVLAAGILAPNFGEVYEPGTDAAYRSWLSTVEPSLFWSEEGIPERLSSLSYQPVFSILIDVPEAHPYLITRSIESVLEQHYKQWQLCVKSPPFDYFDKLAGGDARIQLASNCVLDAAVGEFVLRLDYRDELHPSALLEIVRALNNGERADVVYADEDEMDFYGNRMRAFRKPAFDSEAFLSWNFVGHMVAVRRSALPPLAENADIESWDTMFRILEIPGSPRPRHIPKPLYHFRKGNPTLAPLPREDGNLSPKPLSAHLSRTGVKATIEPGLFPGSFRVVRERQAEWNLVVLVRSEDGAFQHAAVAANIQSQATRVYELMGSGAQLLDPSANPYVIHNLEEIPADIFVFINRPLETLNHAFFEELTSQAMRDDCGVVTGISLDRSGRVLHSTNKTVDAFAGIHSRKSTS